MFFISEIDKSILYRLMEIALVVIVWIRKGKLIGAPIAISAYSKTWHETTTFALQICEPGINNNNKLINNINNQFRKDFNM